MTSAPWSAAQTTPSMMSRVLAGAVGTEHGDGHDLDAGVADAGDARAVVGLGGDDARHLRAVSVRVGRPSRRRRGSRCRRRALPSRSGCVASTPVSRIATVAEPVGVTVSRDVLPADARERPLARSSSGRSGSSRRRAPGWRRRGRRWRRRRGRRRRPRPADGVHAQGGDVGVDRRVVSGEGRLGGSSGGAAGELDDVRGQGGSRGRARRLGERLGRRRRRRRRRRVGRGRVGGGRLLARGAGQGSERRESSAFGESAGGHRAHDEQGQQCQPDLEIPVDVRLRAHSTPAPLVGTHAVDPPLAAAVIRLPLGVRARARHWPQRPTLVPNLPRFVRNLSVCTDNVARKRRKVNGPEAKPSPSAGMG